MNKNKNKTFNFNSKNLFSSTNWKDIKSKPTLVIQTIRGPVVVKVYSVNSEYLRGYAPAFATLTQEATSVAFLPVGFAETFIDFRFGGIMGTNDLPEALVEAYEDYVDNFAKGEYRIKKVQAQIDPAAQEVTVPVNVERTEETVAVTQ